MGVNTATKLRWFERGAAAFAQAFPNALAPLGSNAAPHYVCPLCAQPDDAGKRYRVQLFPRSAVEKGELTAEHVPPKSFGGRELVLTCRRCNNYIGGSQLDAHARRRENPVDALRGVAKKPSHVRLKAGDHEVSVALTVEGDMVTMELPPRKKHANHPRQEKEIREALRQVAVEQSTFGINFAKDLYIPQRANVAWLRHAYLALFAVYGYRYIFQPALCIVRKQVMEPEVEHIPVFLATLPGEHSWSDRRISFIRAPESLQSCAVQFGRYVVFLPKARDTKFYTRIAEDAQARPQARFNGETIAWPTEPFFGLTATSP